MMRSLRAFVLILPVALTSPAFAQPKPPAQALAAAMSQHKLSAIAAADPGDERRFVAALLFPGQLLVISGRHPAPADLRYYVREQKYREAYSALYDAAEREGRLFVQDMGADGFPIDRHDSVDVVYEQAETQTLLDRPPSGKRGDVYDAKYAELNARYAEVLRLLLSRLQPSS